MMCISSPAGRRLAVAKAAMDEAEKALDTHMTKACETEYSRCHYRFCRAARAVADELIAQRFHQMEGD